MASIENVSERNHRPEPTDATQGWMTRTYFRLIRDQRFRFLVVGGFNTAFGYFNFVWIQAVFGHEIHYMGSFVASYIISFAVAFLLHRKLVFRVQGGWLLDLVRFQGVYLVPLGFNLVLLPFLVSGLRWNVYFAQALVVTINTIASFVGHKYFSFRRKS